MTVDDHYTVGHFLEEAIGVLVIETRSSTSRQVCLYFTGGAAGVYEVIVYGLQIDV